MDPAKLKVVELRQELGARGLDIKGVKAVLVERLIRALEEETGQEIPDSSIVDTSTEESFREENTDPEDPGKEANSEPEPSPEQEPEPDEEPYSKEQDQDSRDQSQDYPEQSRDSNQEKRFQEQEDSNQDQDFEESSDQFQNQSASKQYRERIPERIEEDSSDQAQTGFSYQQEDSQPYQREESEPFQQEDSQSQEEGIGKQDSTMEESQENTDDVRIKEEPHFDEFKQQHFEEKPNVEEYQGYETKKESYEADVKMEPDAEVKEERAEGQQEDRKRKRSRWSPQPDKQGWGQNANWSRKEDEPELDDNAVVLGWYDSDLNLEINRTDFLEANPMSYQGFGYIWAGCRATFGFSQGKVCYEVKLLENNDVSHLEDEPSPHVLRVGWSTLKSSLLLGEEAQSYGYGGTAKASNNLKFVDYGQNFDIGDTITCYLDYGEMVTLSYAKNGDYLGDAFLFPATDIEGQALFPHMLSKNVKFQANFGPESEFPIQEGFTWASQVPEDMRVAGPRRPETRGECEMLMMCGLPGCGKTKWANTYVTENSDKFYNILGTNNLIDKMKIQGLPRKRNYSGRWDVLIDKCTKCLNKLLELAAKRRRNYILDQTNVYPSAQKRKMRNFGGFVRRAIVIVPTDEEFQRRVAKREAEEGKDIPDSAVLEMKANFRLPEAGEHFDEVRYIELNEEESRPLVEQYNKEGRDAGFGQQAQISGQGKKFRPDRPQFGRGGSGGFRGGRGFGGGMDRHERGGDRRGGGFRSGGMDRGGRGGWGGRGSDRGRRGDSWRDRSPAGYDRDMDSRPQGGGAWRNNRSNDRDRPYDRNQRGRGGPRGGGFDRDMFRDDDFGRGYGRDMDFGRGYERDDFRGGGGGYDRGFNGRDEGGFGRDGGRGGRGGRGSGGRGGFDRDRGGGRGGFDRNRGGGGGGGGGGGSGFNDRRGGGGNRQGGFDRNNRGGNDGGRGGRDNKGVSSNQDNQTQQGWGNQGYNQGWGQGYNQQGYNQSYNQGYNQGQQGWNQQGWAGYGAANTSQQQQQQQTPAQQTGTAGVAAAPAAAYNTTTPAAGYGQQGYNQATAQQYAQGYWGQYGYGQGWTQNADGTYSYPQGWQQYGYGQQYPQNATAAMTAATPAAGAAAAPANAAAAASK